jgi:5-methylcytosine-specific restriction endonuclease McrA
VANEANSGPLACIQCGCSFEWAQKRGPTKRYCLECVRANNRRRVGECAARKRAAAGKVRRNQQGPLDHHRLLIYAIRRFIVAPKVACADCGEPMMRVEPRGDRCDACAQKRNDQILRTCRSARKRYLRQFKFDPLLVLRRDNWRCYLCGIETPQELRGTTEPNAPEIDHVIPISRGGEHSEGNARCSCRKCNNQKKSKTPQEYREWLAKRAA